MRRGRGVKARGDSVVCELSRFATYSDTRCALPRNEKKEKQKTSPPVTAEKSDGQAFRDDDEENARLFRQIPLQHPEHSAFKTKNPAAEQRGDDTPLISSTN
ncbi:hypothetical protein KOW79_000180 [Hemibagrus wyckioides]|uniref:Uncharacterized protein n=1 Tax=Hemibagrus wyckioides TaxID=337641 RepID=A0A9D3P6K1_9TELE|nr:hypothetical protein KOW79_000180 [Hemibagrus wyckioides]